MTSSHTQNESNMPWYTMREPIHFPSQPDAVRREKLLAHMRRLVRYYVRLHKEPNPRAPRTHENDSEPAVQVLSSSRTESISVNEDTNLRDIFEDPELSSERNFAYEIPQRSKTSSGSHPGSSTEITKRDLIRSKTRLDVLRSIVAILQNVSTVSSRERRMYLKSGTWNELANEVCDIVSGSDMYDMVESEFLSTKPHDEFDCKFRWEEESFWLHYILYIMTKFGFRPYLHDYDAYLNCILLEVDVWDLHKSIEEQQRQESLENFFPEEQVSKTCSCAVCKHSVVLQCGMYVEYEVHYPTLLHRLQLKLCILGNVYKQGEIAINSKFTDFVVRRLLFLLMDDRGACKKMTDVIRNAKICGEENRQKEVHQIPWPCSTISFLDVKYVVPNKPIKGEWTPLPSLSGGEPPYFPPECDNEDILGIVDSWDPETLKVKVMWRLFSNNQWGHLKGKQGYSPYVLGRDVVPYGCRTLRLPPQPHHLHRLLKPVEKSHTEPHEHAQVKGTSTDVLHCVFNTSFLEFSTLIEILGKQDNFLDSSVVPSSVHELLSCLSNYLEKPESWFSTLNLGSPFISRCLNDKIDGSNHYPTDRLSEGAEVLLSQKRSRSSVFGIADRIDDSPTFITSRLYMRFVCLVLQMFWRLCANSKNITTIVKYMKPCSIANLLTCSSACMRYEAINIVHVLFLRNEIRSALLWGEDYLQLITYISCHSIGATDFPLHLRNRAASVLKLAVEYPCVLSLLGVLPPNKSELHAYSSTRNHKKEKLCTKEMNSSLEVPRHNKRSECRIKKTGKEAKNRKTQQSASNALPQEFECYEVTSLFESNLFKDTIDSKQWPTDPGCAQLVQSISHCMSAVPNDDTDHDSMLMFVECIENMVVAQLLLSCKGVLKKANTHIPRKRWLPLLKSKSALCVLSGTAEERATLDLTLMNVRSDLIRELKRADIHIKMLQYISSARNRQRKSTEITIFSCLRWMAWFPAMRSALGLTPYRVGRSALKVYALSEIISKLPDFPLEKQDKTQGMYYFHVTGLIFRFLSLLIRGSCSRNVNQSSPKEKSRKRFPSSTSLSRENISLDTKNIFDIFRYAAGVNAVAKVVDSFTRIKSLVSKQEGFSWITDSWESQLLIGITALVMELIEINEIRDVLLRLGTLTALHELLQPYTRNLIFLNCKKALQRYEHFIPRPIPLESTLLKKKFRTRRNELGSTTEARNIGNNRQLALLDKILTDSGLLQTAQTLRQELNLCAHSSTFPLIETREHFDARSFDSNLSNIDKVPYHMQMDRSMHGTSRATTCTMQPRYISDSKLNKTSTYHNIFQYSEVKAISLAFANWESDVAHVLRSSNNHTTFIGTSSGSVVAYGRDLLLEIVETYEEGRSYTADTVVRDLINAQSSTFDFSASERTTARTNHTVDEIQTHCRLPITSFAVSEAVIVKRYPFEATNQFTIGSSWQPQFGNVQDALLLVTKYSSSRWENAPPTYALVDFEQENIISTYSSFPVCQMKDPTYSSVWKLEEVRESCLSMNDQLLLCGGTLWDTRRSARKPPVHLFDRIDEGSCLFHRNGSHVIVDTGIWDLRTGSLLQTVPAFSRCETLMSPDSSVLLAYSSLQLSAYNSKTYAHENVILDYHNERSRIIGVISIAGRDASSIGAIVWNTGGSHMDELDRIDHSSNESTFTTFLHAGSAPSMLQPNEYDRYTMGAVDTNYGPTRTQSTIENTSNTRFSDSQLSDSTSEASTWESDIGSGALDSYEGLFADADDYMSSHEDEYISTILSTSDDERDMSTTSSSIGSLDMGDEQAYSTAS